MALTIAQKMQIRGEMEILTVNAPSEYLSRIQSLSDHLKVSEKTKDYQQIHWFVRNKKEMEKELNKVLKLLREGVICWIYYPKKSSKVQTDLTRDQGWEGLTDHTELQWISLISFDDIWSAFGMRLKTPSDNKKTPESKERPIFKYVDPATKSVRLPEDLEKAMKKNKKATSFFETLSFTNKKEWLEWVITAKREETRNERISQTIERLEKNWKNPRNL